jgi:hypothetical protein
MLRFSGHDTFHCKEQWLLKGLQLIVEQGDTSIFKENSAIYKLGVGKNMVRSIQHWLKAFDLVDEEDTITPLAKFLFTEQKADPYLENESSLWILQYHLCKANYASIFKLVFADYFLSKASLEFTQSQIISYLDKKILEDGQRKASPKTLSADYKVFVKTYLVSGKNLKTIEDDFSAPLLGLNLISDTGQKNARNESIYKINKDLQEGLNIAVFAYVLLSEFPEESSVNLDQIRNTIGAYLCLSNEGLDGKISALCDMYANHFVYKEDAGIKQLQIKDSSEVDKYWFLNNSYKNYALHS